MCSLSFSIIGLYELFESYCDHLCSLRSLAVTFLSNLSTIRKQRSRDNEHQSCVKNCLNHQATQAIICVELRHQWHLFLSDIFDSCNCNLGPTILSSFFSLSTFSRVLVLFLARMATLSGSDSDLPNEVCNIINCVTIYYEKDAQTGMPSFRKKRSEVRFQGKWRRWKLWKKLSSVFTGHLLNMGMNNLFLSLIRE